MKTRFYFNLELEWITKHIKALNEIPSCINIHFEIK